MKSNVRLDDMIQKESTIILKSQYPSMLHFKEWYPWWS